jgi:hypothetical protein
MYLPRKSMFIGAQRKYVKDKNHIQPIVPAVLDFEPSVGSQIFLNKMRARLSNSTV